MATGPSKRPSKSALENDKRKKLTYTWLYMYMLMRDAEGRKKQAKSIMQTIRQSNTVYTLYVHVYVHVPGTTCSGLLRGQSKRHATNIPLGGGRVVVAMNLQIIQQTRATRGGDQGVKVHLLDVHHRRQRL